MQNKRLLTEICRYSSGEKSDAEWTPDFINVTSSQKNDLPCGVCENTCSLGAVKVLRLCGRPLICSGHSVCRGTGLIQPVRSPTGWRSSALDFIASCWHLCCWVWSLWFSTTPVHGVHFARWEPWRRVFVSWKTKNHKRQKKWAVLKWYAPSIRDSEIIIVDHRWSISLRYFSLFIFLPSTADICTPHAVSVR